MDRLVFSAGIGIGALLALLVINRFWGGVSDFNIGWAAGSITTTVLSALLMPNRKREA